MKLSSFFSNKTNMPEFMTEILFLARLFFWKKKELLSWLARLRRRRRPVKFLCLGNLYLVSLVILW